jgi:hypothetical protein
MSFHVISCHFMSFHVSLDFSDHLSLKLGGDGQSNVKYVFLGFRRQLRCLADGKKIEYGQTYDDYKCGNDGRVTNNTFKIPMGLFLPSSNQQVSYCCMLDAGSLLSGRPGSKVQFTFAAPIEVDFKALRTGGVDATGPDLLLILPCALPSASAVAVVGRSAHPKSFGLEYRLVSNIGPFKSGTLRKVQNATL